MDVLDIDACRSCVVLQDDLLQEHEGTLVLSVLPHLHLHLHISATLAFAHFVK